MAAMMLLSWVPFARSRQLNGTATTTKFYFPERNPGKALHRARVPFPFPDKFLHCPVASLSLQDTCAYVDTEWRLGGGRGKSRQVAASLW